MSDKPVGRFHAWDNTTHVEISAPHNKRKLHWSVGHLSFPVCLNSDNRKILQGKLLKFSLAAGFFKS